MFVGRTSELKELERLYLTDIFQMPVIYGRRRVGKSTLIRKFIENKKAIFFTAIESNEQKNLELFSKSIYKALLPDAGSLPSFPSFEDAFDYLNKYIEKDRLILVIDEYPYLAASDKSISSRLQNYIDNEWRHSKLYLILCGSSMSFMERQVLGYQSPLYGRRTAQLKIHPFDYRTSGEFVPGYSAEDKALVYGVTGGIPKYLELFDESVSVHKNIVRLFFSESGYLYEETVNLLKQELREVNTYNAVLEAVASGANRVNEIATKTHIDTASVSYVLKSLIELNIIKKEAAVTEERNKKKTLYTVSDTMYRFWYRFIPNATNLISQGQGKAFYDEIVKPQIPDYMGKVFEDMCREFCLRISGTGELPSRILNVGRWWGTNKREHREEEIDIIGINPMEKVLILGECKYQNQPIGMNVAEQLLQKELLFPGYRVQGFVLFSKNGFTDEVIQIASNKISLFTLDDLY